MANTGSSKCHHQNGSGKADSGRVNVADQNNGLIELTNDIAAQFETVTMGSRYACLPTRSGILRR